MERTQILEALFASLRRAAEPREQVQARQRKRLYQILRYAYDNAPYYRKSFEAAGITCADLERHPISDFPTLDKSTFQRNADDILTAPVENAHRIHSSGSTGSPQYFVYDEAAWNAVLIGVLRGALWDMTPEEIRRLLAMGPKVLYVAATDGSYAGTMAVGDGLSLLGVEQRQLDINTPLKVWDAVLRAYRPNVLIGYPSALKILAETAEIGKVLRVITCGEPLSPTLRAEFEHRFDCPVVNFYGASESLALGVETGAKTGMFLFDDLNYMEELDGELYLTTLYNLTQPLIRYHLTDQFHPLPSLAPCGFSRGQVVLSRNEDVLWFNGPDGAREFLHPLAIEGFCVPGLLDYQFRKTGAQAFEMLAETTPDGDRDAIHSQMKRDMGNILRDKHLDFVTFTLRFVSRIEPDPHTGKKRLILPDRSPLEAAI